MDIISRKSTRCPTRGREAQNLIKKKDLKLHNPKLKSLKSKRKKPKEREKHSKMQTLTRRSWT